MFFDLHKTEVFVERWLQRLSDQDPSTEDGCIDRYITQYIVLNHLYNALWTRLHGPWKGNRSGGGDKRRATVHLASSIDCSSVINDPVTIGPEGLPALMRAIAPEGPFHLVEPSDDHFQGYNELDTDKKRVQRLLEALYLLRCNMFHGEKSLNSRQEMVLAPANACLGVVVAASLASLRSQVT